MIERDYLIDHRRGNVPDFNRGIGTPETHAAVSPVRNIPITAAMRLAEQRRHVQASSTAIAWRASIFGVGRGPAAPQPKLQTSHLNLKPAARHANSKPCAERCGRVTAHSSGRCCQCRKHKLVEVQA